MRCESCLGTLLTPGELLKAIDAAIANAHISAVSAVERDRLRGVHTQPQPHELGALHLELYNIKSRAICACRCAEERAA